MKRAIPIIRAHRRMNRQLADGEFSQYTSRQAIWQLKNKLQTDEKEGNII